MCKAVGLISCVLINSFGLCEIVIYNKKYIFCLPLEKKKGGRIGPRLGNIMCKSTEAREILTSSGNS